MNTTHAQQPSMICCQSLASIDTPPYWGIRQTADVARVCHAADTLRKLDAQRGQRLFEVAMTVLTEKPAGDRLRRLINTADSLALAIQRQH